MPDCMSAPMAPDGLNICVKQAYVIDDDRDIRESLQFVLGTLGIVGSPFASGRDFLDRLQSSQPAPILLDVRMLGMDGIEVLRQLQDRQIQWPVIVMSGHGDIAVAVRAIKLGAIDFLEKPFETDALEAALKFAYSQIDALKYKELIRQRLARLTPRENDVMSLLTDGAPNKQVAYQLGLSIRTVEDYRRAALAKLHVRSIAEVVSLKAAAQTSLPV